MISLATATSWIRPRAVILLVVVATLAGDAAAEMAGPSPLTIVQTAFDAMFNYPSVRTVELNVHRNGQRVTRREFQVAYKKIRDRGHTLLRFTEPDYLRDNALLIVERRRGITDSWLYQDATRVARRINTSQKADSFYGSDLALEDLEHHDWSRYELNRLPDEEEQDESCYVVEAISDGHSQYSKVVVRIEKTAFAVVRIDFFKGTGERPFKSLLVPFLEIERGEGGILKPRRFVVQQHGRKSYTEVVFSHIESDPTITSSVFSSMRLQQSGTNLYELVERLSRSERGLR